MSRTDRSVYGSLPLWYRILFVLPIASVVAGVLTGIIIVKFAAAALWRTALLILLLSRFAARRLLHARA
jgi:uncharacterized membrane protein YoaK (UPF0700 family)